MTSNNSGSPCFWQGKENALNDVTLIGNDGGKVPASRAILVASSPAFKRFFSSRFIFPSELAIDCPSCVLRSVVKYCYTKELDLGFVRPEETDTVGLHMPDAEAVSILRVRDAAYRLDLPILHRLVTAELEDSYDTACVCAILQELLNQGESEGLFWESFMQLVEVHPSACFSPKEPSHNKGILACSLPLLIKLFELRPEKQDRFAAVKALKKWGKEYGACLDAEQRAEFQELSGRIQLESIQSRHLGELEKFEHCSLFARTNYRDASYTKILKGCTPSSRVGTARRWESTYCNSSADR